MNTVLSLLLIFNIYLPIVFGRPSQPIEFIVYRQCLVSGDMSAKMSEFPFSAQAEDGSWTGGRTDFFGVGRLNGAFYKVYLGPDQQYAGDVWHDPKAKPSWLYWRTSTC